MENLEAFRSANKRFEAMMCFDIHSGRYVSVNLFLAVVSFATTFSSVFGRWSMLLWGFAGHLILSWFSLSQNFSPLSEAGLKRIWARPEYNSEGNHYG